MAPEKMLRLIERLFIALKKIVGVRRGNWEAS